MKEACISIMLLNNVVCINFYTNLCLEPFSYMHMHILRDSITTWYEILIMRRILSEFVNICRYVVYQESTLKSATSSSLIYHNLVHIGRNHGHAVGVTYTSIHTTLSFDLDTSLVYDKIKMKQQLLRNCYSNLISLLKT